MADESNVAASFSTQANALLRKNLIYQVCFPLFFYFYQSTVSNDDSEMYSVPCRNGTLVL